MRISEFIFESNTTGFQLYVDMDGVLVDFVNGVKRVMNNPNYDMDSKEDKKDFWKKFNSMPHEDAVSLWANFDWAPGGKELWKYASKFDPKILSAPGTTSRHIIEAGKTQWIEKNLSPKPSGVIFSRNKEKQANKFSILIDDTKYNIDKFEANGGIGILYKTGDWKSAVNQLQERFNFPK